MYHNTPSHRHFSGSKGRRGREIKHIPKAVLLSAIENSKAQAQPEEPQHTEPITHRFEDFSLDPQLTANLVSKGYTQPTPIQDRAIPAILSGRDVIGAAQTGTGKTAAFLIPMIQKITKDRNQRVLVIAPTRELAVQIHKELHELSRGLSVRSAMVIGGANEWRQLQDLKRDPHVVVATPGRLKDFLSTHQIRLSGFRNVVLDEVDRMVDIGFIADITYFISLLPKERQSLFFSATISGKVGEILDQFVRDPVTVQIGSINPALTVKQEAIHVSGQVPKIEMLHDLLIQEGFEKVLIFGRTKWGVQRLSDELRKRGFHCDAIHGNKRQNQRQRVLDMFMQNQIQVLLATDVASRGLDIPDVTHVINYDIPETMEDYIHRIGRTGRANKRGIALTFVD